MANNESVSTVDRKGKPSGNVHENETLQEAATEAQATDNVDVTTLKVKHPNRHLHKGEDIQSFRDFEE
jgi:hypothetical protein